jgi:hypothetical protein
MNILRALPFVAGLTLGLVAVPEAHAQDAAAAAEKVRLQGEMKKLAAKNAWAGVESKFEELEKLKLPLTFDDYFLGAQSARFLGKTYETYMRLEKAKQIDPRPEILTELEGIEARYGRVDIQGNPRKRPPLEIDLMPFAQDERKSVEWAITVVANTGEFKGMLPLDVTYSIAGQSFTAVLGPDWQVVDISKAKGGPSVETIRWSGPFASVGYGYVSSPEPEASDDVSVLQPGAISGSGVSVRAGAEMGFTEIFGVAGSLGYTVGGANNDLLHDITASVGAVIRPGQARFSFGPTYGLIAAHGYGVASWWDINQDPERYPSAEIEYRGQALVGGFEATGGFGLIDLGKLQGMAELGGSWQTDGQRAYTGFFLRAGIQPKIERFKG